MLLIVSQILLFAIVLVSPHFTMAINPIFYGQNQMPVTSSAPTFIQEAETSTWVSGSTSKTTASFNVLADDVLVAFSISENELYTQSISGGSLSWTLQQSVDVSGFTEVRVWTATVDTNKSMTVTFSNTSSSAFGGNVLTFRNTGGVGASAKANASGAPSLNLTTTKANSAIIVAAGDWNAVSGGARTWRTGASAIIETNYNYVPGEYTSYGGYHANAGAIGTKTVGLSAPTGQSYSIVAVEVRGP